MSVDGARRVDTATSPAARQRTGLVLAILGAVAFSGKAIIVKLAYRHGVDAVTLIAWRMLFALPCFAVLSWWAGRRKPRLGRRDWWIVAGLGFCGYYLASFLDFAGLQYISAGLERLVLYLNPTIVLALGAVLFGHRVGRHQWPALAVSYAGVLLVFAHEVSFRGAHVVLGTLLVLASACSYALYLVYSGREVHRLGALRLTGLASTVACVCCIVQFVLLRPLSALLVAPPVIWLSLLNATACTVAPVLMVMMAIERLGASVAAQCGMIGPLATVILGAMLLGEPLTPWVMAGTVVAVYGVWLLARSTRVQAAGRV